MLQCPVFLRSSWFPSKIPPCAWQCKQVKNYIQDINFTLSIHSIPMISSNQAAIWGFRQCNGLHTCKPLFVLTHSTQRHLKYSRLIIKNLVGRGNQTPDHCLNNSMTLMPLAQTGCKDLLLRYIVLNHHIVLTHTTKRRLMGWSLRIKNLVGRGNRTPDHCYTHYTFYI